MTLFKKIQNKFSSLEAILPPLTKRIPIVVVDNDHKIYIENGCQIIHFTSSKIHIRTTIGNFYINGNNLFINSMYQEEVIIEGEIKELIYKRGERKL